MKISNLALMPSSVAVLVLAMTTVEVRSFAVQHAIPTLGCGGTTSTSSRHAATSCRVSMTAPAGGSGLSRTAWMSRVLGVAFTGAAAATQAPAGALAEVGVGEGGLPDGARQFSNLVKVQKDWIALGKTVKSQGADVSAGEWKNVALFLRKVYQLGGDLEFLAGTFSADKKKTAMALVRGIQKEVEAADKPAREKDSEAFMAAQASVEKKFEDFMELFNNVPSEL
eukprot:jgi/Undpi1/5016/HiC_scaffold_19.g08368.m1